MQAFQQISHYSIAPETLNDIYFIKALVKPLDRDSQARWMLENLKDEDMHLLLYEGEILQAYLNIIPDRIILDAEEIKIFGIGNVCARTKKQGYGSLIRQHANNLIIKEDLVGLLFCKQALLPFYERFGWKTVDQGKLQIKDERPFFAMIFNHDLPRETLQYFGKLF